VEAALKKDREAVYQAVMLDPLTSALLTLDEIRSMVDEMFQAERRWLPGFH
jgi:alpha-galactosidase